MHRIFTITIGILAGCADSNSPASQPAEFPSVDTALHRRIGQAAEQHEARFRQIEDDLKEWAAEIRAAERDLAAPVDPLVVELADTPAHRNPVEPDSPLDPELRTCVRVLRNKDRETSLRRQACDKLVGYREQPAARAALIEGLADERVGIRAAQALRSMGPAARQDVDAFLATRPEGLEKLLATLIVSDQDLESGLIARLRDTTASDAFRALSADQLYEMVTDTRKPRRQYVAYLLDAALGDPVSDVRRRATLAYAACEPTDRRAVAALLFVAVDPDSSTADRCAAIDHIGALAEVPDGAVRVLQQFRSTDGPVADSCQRALRQIRERDEASQRRDWALLEETRATDEDVARVRGIVQDRKMWEGEKRQQERLLWLNRLVEQL